MGEMKCINDKTKKPRRKYKNAMSAENSIVWIQSSNKSDIPLAPYRCPTCKHYHISSKDSIYRMHHKIAEVGLEAIRQLGLGALVIANQSRI